MYENLGGLIVDIDNIKSALEQLRNKVGKCAPDEQVSADIDILGTALEGVGALLRKEFSAKRSELTNA